MLILISWCLGCSTFLFMHYRNSYSKGQSVMPWKGGCFGFSVHLKTSWFQTLLLLFAYIFWPVTFAFIMSRSQLFLSVSLILCSHCLDSKSHLYKFTSLSLSLPPHPPSTPTLYLCYGNVLKLSLHPWLHYLLYKSTHTSRSYKKKIIIQLLLQNYLE